MELLIDKVLHLFEQSECYWITDNRNINTDNVLIWKEKDSINILYDNEWLNIKYDDIIDIAFNKVQNMIVSTIKVTSRPSILIHYL